MKHISHLHLMSFKKLYQNKSYLIITVVAVLILGTGSVVLALSNSKNSNRDSKISSLSQSKSASPADKTIVDKDQPVADTSEATDTESNGTSSSTDTDKQQQATKSSEKSGTSNNSNKSTSAPQSSIAPPEPYIPVAPNPYCPAPNFIFSVQREVNSYNTRLNVSSSPSDPSNTPACGGGINYSYLTVTRPSNGPICDGIVYPIDNYNWGVSCSIYGNAVYGNYTFTFTTTGTNGYGQKTTRTINHTINYQPQ